MNRGALVLLAALIVNVSSGCSGLVTGSTNAAPVAPSIAAQPTSQAVAAGQTATFSVTATGSAPLTYQWKKNSAAISSANSSTYTTSSTTSSDNGEQFSVVVSNSAGNATSSPATLTVSAAAVAPSITTQPANQTVTAGQTATFSVTATGSAPLTYQWKKNSAAISSANSSTYTTSSTTSSDNGEQFSVVVSNSAGNATSSPATLTVSAAAVAPSITTQPANQTVTAGQTATFSVTATGSAPLTYQWKKNSATIAGAASSSYTTPSTTSTDNGGQFSVVVSNSAGNATSSPATLTVSAAAVAPSITTQPANQTVTAGQTATFSVTATGSAPLTYQWKKNSATIAGAASSSYTTPSTTSTDNGGQFSVVVSNSAGNATSSPATLTVSAAAVAPSITTQPTGQTVTAGQSATFSVTATGSAPLTYQWKKNSVAISGAASSSYTTPSTTSTDNGAQFSVVVSNSAGNATSSPATLTVSAAAVAPSITTQPTGQTVTAGQSATFSVTATGSAPLTYQWKKNSVAISGAASSSYTTPSTTSTDNGAQFSAVVSNSTGSVTSSVATLTVNAASAPLQISTAQLPGGFVAGGYSSTLAATGGSTPYSWSVLSGSLPNGLTLSSAGVVSGTPSLAGSFSFTVQVKDASSTTASRNFSINVASPTPTVAITSPASGSTVSGTISVSGTASDSVSITSVQVSVDGGSYSNASGTNNWSFTLNTAALSNGAHSLAAKTTDAAGISASSAALPLTVNNGSTASNCTIFASPSGNDSNSGSTSSSPKTFNGAAAASQPGSVVCLLGGTYNLSSTFYPPTSGSPSSWIIYQNFGDGPVNFLWTAGATGQPMFKLGNGSFPSGAAYLEFKGFNLDGQNYAADGFFCQGGHHISFIGNSINNTGGSGVGAVNCDYLTSDHNLINHNGYLYGWTSAISYNSAQWFDSYPGFHNIVSNNIITGEFDGSSNHTDGNGIILDLSNGSYNYSTANTPPALIINNVVYGNGGRCIQANVVTNFWIVNNTCYKNNLDTSLGNVGSFTTQNSNNGYFINNIAVSVAGNNPSYDQESSNASIQYYADMYTGSSNNFSYSDPSQLINANPLFLLPPSLSIGGYTTSLAPSLLGSGLTLTPLLSPALGRGIDPSTLPGLPANIISDLKLYIYTDINGKARPQGGGSDLGAYQH